MKKELSTRAQLNASEEYIKLFQYIVDVPNGTMVEYSQIQKDTGIKMTTQNRNRLHRACVASGREYINIRNIGYKFADGANAMGIIGNAINRLGNAAMRTKRTHINIKIDIYEEMSAEDKQKFNFTESVTNAMTASIENSRRLKEINKPRQLSEPKPIIPDDIS